MTSTETLTPRTIARERFRASCEVPLAFFAAEAERVTAACRELARAFHRGGRLLVFGTGARRSDALHVSVEFVHPVIVGKRALPAIALQAGFADRLRALGEPGDVALGLADGDDPEVRGALQAAREAGLVTIALTGRDPGPWPADFLFAVDSDDPFVVQETHETLYHVLWELVHVFLEHPGTLR